jgi:hypothetical protein
MKTKSLIFALFLLVPLVFISCTKKEDTSSTDNLFVRFENDASSEYTITSIEIRSRGIVDQADQPIGNWGSNLLTNGSTIAPGGFTNFTLSIPNSNWSEYRISVDDGNGNTVLVQQNADVGVQSELPITHWGSDSRTVSVIVKYNASYDVIYISGWSDFAGITE